MFTADPITSTSDPGETTVLVVDDNVSDAELFRYGFSEAGINCRIQQVTTAGSARRWLAEHKKPKFIVLDIRLPDESGLAVLKTITVDPELKTIPSLVLSDSIRDSDRLDVQGCGSICAVKPFDLDGWPKLARWIATLWRNDQISSTFAA